MHDKSTRVRGCIEHKSKGCVEDFAGLIRVLFNVCLQCKEFVITHDDSF